MAKTPAASVDDTTAPSKNPSLQEKFKAQTAPTAINAAVNKTPTVASENPSHKIVRVEAQSVSNPPANKMHTRAATPTVLAIPASSKAKPPGPSTPANMPMAKKTTRTGIPNRSTVLLRTTLSATKSAAPANKASKFMVSF